MEYPLSWKIYFGKIERGKMKKTPKRIIDKMKKLALEKAEKNG